MRRQFYDMNDTYYKMFDYNVKFTGELKLSFSYVD